MPETYWVDGATSRSSGPSIFARRLSFELLRQSRRLSPFRPDHHVARANISPEPRGRRSSALRLDGFQYSKWALRSDPVTEKIRHALSSYKSFIYQSEFSYRAFCDVAGHDSPGCIIPNGAQPLGFEIQPRDYVICVADWRPNKRLKDIVKAFCSRRLSGVRLIVVGHNPEKNLMDEASNNINFVGRKSNSVTRRLVAASRGLIHIAWLDNCPNAVVEALVDGIPVLTNRNGGTQEIVQQNGLSVDLETAIEALSACDTRLPPPADQAMLITGVLALLEADRGFERQDLHISSITDEYIKFLKKT